LFFNCRQCRFCLKQLSPFLFFLLLLAEK
jgi:hypothetical protein